MEGCLGGREALAVYHTWALIVASSTPSNFPRTNSGKFPGNSSTMFHVANTAKQRRPRYQPLTKTRAEKNQSWNVPRKAER